MAMFSVSPLKEDELLARMARLGIREEDLEETFVRSSGPGGQHVNKTATAVALTHRPSGVTVRCQKTRSQAMNRFYARRILIDKIERQRLGEQSAEQQRIEKIHRQKRRPSPPAPAHTHEDQHPQPPHK